MKKNVWLIAAVVLASAALFVSLSSLPGLALGKQSLQAGGAPGMVSYQGQVLTSGVPYDGTGYFKLAIVDAAGTNSYWSNDGTSTGGTEPTASISLEVENGLFSVLLGDTSLTGMTLALDETVFSDPDTYLRMWFSDDDATFTQLGDQKIAAVPYALQAQTSSSAANADTLDGQHANVFQLRVTGTCPVDQAVRVVNTDGSVVCEDIPQPDTFSLTTLEPNGVTATYSSIAIGKDGLGLISYNYSSWDDLRVAHCTDINCNSATITTLDTTGMVGFCPDIAIGTDGFGLISYWDATNGNLKVAHCSNTNCTSKTLYILDSVGDVGRETSIAIGSDGFGLISHQDYANGDLKVSHCDNTLCSSATTYTLDSIGDVADHTSIAIGADGLGLITYTDTTNEDLKVAHCDDILCSSATTYVLDSIGNVGWYPTVAIGVDGLGLISYYDTTNGDLKVAHCDDILCSSATTYVLDSNGDVGWGTSIAIGADGLGVIGYRDMTNLYMKVAHCNYIHCNSATISTLDASGTVYQDQASVAIGVDGLALFSYQDFSHLKVAHCSNLLCLPINWEH